MPLTMVCRHTKPKSLEGDKNALLCTQKQIRRYCRTPVASFLSHTTVRIVRYTAVQPHECRCSYRSRKQISPACASVCFERTSCAKGITAALQYAFLVRAATYIQCRCTFYQFISDSTMARDSFHKQNRIVFHSHL